jgi:hypothetical protein
MPTKPNAATTIASSSSREARGTFLTNAPPDERDARQLQHNDDRERSADGEEAEAL